VASAQQDALLSALSSSLQGEAVDLSDEGASEYAFPVEISSEVFDALLIANFSILGGDLWKKEDDGFRSCHDGWFANSSSADSSSAWRNFRERLPEAAGYYLTFVGRRLPPLSRRFPDACRIAWSAGWCCCRLGARMLDDPGRLKGLVDGGAILMDVVS
jgi:hypothetical protein